MCLAVLSPAGADTSENTTAHQWLSREYEVLLLSKNPPSPQDYEERLQRLDLLLEEMSTQLPRNGAPGNAPAEIFGSIDRMLAQRGFICRIKTETLWDTLTPGLIPQNSYHNSRASDRFLPRNQPLFPYDCDTGSVLYLSLGERLGYPISMVEVPNHNFVRWRTGEGSYVNWDANHGRSYTDDEYREGEVPGVGGFSFRPGGPDHYLKDLSPAQLEGYHVSIVAGSIDGSKFPWTKLSWFLRVRDLFPSSPTLKNNIAWLIATQKALERSDLLELAIELASQAVEMKRDNNFVDTLAAAHAARGEFEKAIAVERGGNNDPVRIQNYERRIKPTDPGWQE